AKPVCPEREGGLGAEVYDRRGFLRAAGGCAAALALGGLVAGRPTARAADGATAKPADRPAKPAEDLVRELYASLSDDQKKESVLAFDHGAARGSVATRLRFYNAPLGKRLGDAYTKPQQELIERIMRSLSAGEEGFRRLSRNGNYDTGGGLQ